MELDQEAAAYARTFKPVAEEVVGESLSEEDYLHILVQIAIEKMAEDVIHPRESSTLWETILLMLRRDPENFAEFMVEVLRDEEDGLPGGWERYIS